jgi:hypothetical protein
MSRNGEIVCLRQTYWIGLINLPQTEMEKT